MKKTIFIAACFIVLISCKEEKSLHVPFPETIQAAKTSEHVRLPGTSIYVAAPSGFAKSVDENGVRYSKGKGSHEYIFISRQPGDQELTPDVKKVKKELLSDIVTIQPLIYNGHKGVFFETKNYNIYDAEMRVPLPAGEMLRVQAQYRGDSDPATINAIMTAMQQVFYDEVNKPDLQADQQNRIQLNTDASRFKLAAAMKDEKGAISYYYTVNGKPYDGSPGYLWVFESGIYFEGVSGNVKADDQDFPSFREHLRRQGFNVTAKKMPYLSSPINHRVSYYEGTDDSNKIPVSLMLYEVKHGQSVIVMIGVAPPGDDLAIAELKRLAATIKIIE